VISENPGEKGSRPVVNQEVCPKTATESGKRKRAAALEALAKIGR